MAIIVDLGKLRVKEILSTAYQYAQEETRREKFGVDNPDDYPRGIVIYFMTKKDKIDWIILEEIANELPWFFAQRKSMTFSFEMPEFYGRHDMEIFFKNRLTLKLSELGLDCYHQSFSRD